ncbi:hypothetical protein ACDX66_00815 [Peribacillus frigoritolerans]
MKNNSEYGIESIMEDFDIYEEEIVKIPYTVIFYKKNTICGAESFLVSHWTQISFLIEECYSKYNADHHLAYKFIEAKKEFCKMSGL